MGGGGEANKNTVHARVHGDPIYLKLMEHLKHETCTWGISVSVFLLL